MYFDMFVGFRKEPNPVWGGVQSYRVLVAAIRSGGSASVVKRRLDHARGSARRLGFATGMRMLPSVKVIVEGSL